MVVSLNKEAIQSDVNVSEGALKVLGMCQFVILSLR